MLSNSLMVVCWYNTNEPLFSCKNSGSPKRQPFIIDCIIQKMEVFPMSIIIGIDHGYYAIKTAHCSFPAGLTSYGEHEPYSRSNLWERTWNTKKIAVEAEWHPLLFSLMWKLTVVWFSNGQQPDWRRFRRYCSLWMVRIMPVLIGNNGWV